jgi:carboxypeptidase Taq
LNPDEQAIMRNIAYATKYYYNVPKKIIVRKEEVTSQAFPVWKEARETNNFKLFLPFLTEIVSLNKEIAGYLGYKTNPYDALLDQYEPELTAADCKGMFDGIKGSLLELMKRIRASKGYSDTIPFIGTDVYYPIEEQKKLLTALVRSMGFDFSSGRIDVSAHPFTTTLADYDIRFTTSYNTHDFRESFTAAMHEAGHGLYEQGIQKQYAHSPLQGGVSLGIHESLSRFWENMVGKNPHFLRAVAPLFQTMYGDQLAEVDAETLVKAFNQVKPNLIRIHADEVSYSLHIILRFEMENELINGKLAVKDAPEAWRAKAQTLLGITPETDREGILQDVHWAYGEIGYFPSYALGNIYGAQFLHAMEKDIDFEKTLRDGNLGVIKEWLDTHIHAHGSRYFPKELVQRVTEEPMNYKYFLDYLNKKYTQIYEL